jgi:endo-1,4-beta-D-glucanase Y
MKKLFLLALTIIIGFSAMSQCTSSITWKASKGEMLDENGNVMDTKTGNIVIESSRTNFSLVLDENQNEVLRGNVKDMVCEWKIPFKTGKTTFKSSLSGGNESRDGEITIEGKDDKITILVDTKQRKFRFVVDSYKEN